MGKRMISLTPLQYDENILKQYIYKTDGTTPKEGNNILHSNIVFVQDRIRYYQKDIQNYYPLESISYDDNELLKKKLYAIYDSNSQNIKTLKTNIRNISKTVCPYCGIQNEPYRIDHYLPRSVYPEFSILSENLIPACDICNDIYKKDHYVASDGLRLFYNPYFDNFIDNEQFLKCDLQCENNYLIVNFYIDNINNDKSNKILQNHFTKLSLNQRYKDIIVKDLFPEFYNEFVEYDEVSQQEIFIDVNMNEIKSAIDRRIRGLRSFNQNYWRKVFWIALKECEECLNLIIEKKITLS
jgi:5-methylcytosine-specific restriction endonuclease McrA